MDGNSGPVVLINLFEVRAGADDGFIAAWERARDFLQTQEGYRTTELHQSLGPDAEFRFVNVAEWASPAAFQAAVGQPDFPGRELPSRLIRPCTRWWPRTRHPRRTPGGWC
jgi:heme-degrading monooxygenase HmoA